MPNTPGKPAAWRLTFAYEGSDVHFERKEQFTMVVPGSSPTEGYRGQTGYWVELRDTAGKVIYRVILHDPMPQYYEVHQRGGPTHTPVKERRGSFMVLVPALPEPTTVVFFGTDQPPVQPIGNPEAERARPATPRIGIGAAHEMASVSLEAIQP
jgi:hypothetical protein